MVDGKAFIVGLESMEKAVASFLHLCFVANMSYPKVNRVFHDGEAAGSQRIS